MTNQMYLENSIAIVKSKVNVIMIKMAKMFSLLTNSYISLMIFLQTKF